MLDLETTSTHLNLTVSATDNVLPYDTDAYAASLSYLGKPERVAGLPWPVIIRAIPNSDRVDAIGPWPYASPVQVDQVPLALKSLRAMKIVTFTAFIRPDRSINAAELLQAGLDCVPLKEHFVFDAIELPPEWSKKTRYHISAARRRWTVRPFDLSTTWPLLANFHKELAARRSMSKIADVDTAHFEQLAHVPGLIALGAYDAIGLAAALIVADTQSSIHFHAILGHQRAYQQRGFYALYDAALNLWSQTRLLCMGGAPAGPDGAGIEKFKRRFATSAQPIMMIKAILDPEACAQLSAQRGAPGFFPPYRTPND